MKLRLNNVRLAFPNIFEPQVSDDGKSSYGASLLLDPNDPQVKAINATIEAVAKEKWTSKADVLLKQIRAADKTALHFLISNDGTDPIGGTFATLNGVPLSGPGGA